MQRISPSLNVVVLGLTSVGLLQDSYPTTAPKVNLETTGDGSIRFNPNLYNCGKVCLSLLGTWRGQATENWNPKISTLLQVLCSIQAIIMSEEIYFNEPGFEHEQGTPEGARLNTGYCNIVRFGNIKFAMTGQIRQPAQGFEDVIRAHFWRQKAHCIVRDRPAIPPPPHTHPPHTHPITLAQFQLCFCP